MIGHAVRAHRSVIEQVAEIYGDQPFTSRDLRQNGIPEAFVKKIKYFHGSCVVEKLAVDPSSKAATWRLTGALRAYLRRTEGSA